MELSPTECFLFLVMTSSRGRGRGRERRRGQFLKAFLQDEHAVLRSRLVGGQRIVALTALRRNGLRHDERDGQTERETETERERERERGRG